MTFLDDITMTLRRDIIVSKFETWFPRYNFAKYPDGNYVSAVTNEAFLLFKAGYHAYI